MLKKLSLSVALATLSMGALIQSAEAASFSFSYTTQGGDVLAGMLEGEVQEDNDTVIVSAITMPLINDSPASDITFIDSFSNLVVGLGLPPVVSLSGTPTSMDLFACVDPVCDEGFAFDGLGLSFGTPAFVGGESYGNVLEPYIQENWSLTSKSVPESSTVVALAVVGGSLLLSKRVKA